MNALVKMDEWGRMDRRTVAGGDDVVKLGRCIWILNCTAVVALRHCVKLPIGETGSGSISDGRPASTPARLSAAAAGGHCYDRRDVVTTYGRMLGKSSVLHLVDVRPDLRPTPPTTRCSWRCPCANRPTPQHRALPRRLDLDDVSKQPYDASQLLKPDEARCAILLLVYVVHADSQFAAVFTGSAGPNWQKWRSLFAT